jgi:hypothetical protein
MDLKELTDIELMKAYWEAVEMQIGYKIKQLKDEMSRRNREE